MKTMAPTRGAEREESRMETANATAQLVDPEAIGEGFVTAVLPRAEVEEAAGSEGAADLLLDVARSDEATTISVSWDRADLERLLAASSGDRVTLAFDPSQLEQAFDEEDVEAHGIKERALILSVAATTMAGSVGVHSAFAAPVDVMGDRASAAQATAIGGAVGASGEQSPAEAIGAAGVVDIPGGAVAAAGTMSPAEATGAPGVLDHTGGAIGAAGVETPAQATGGAGITPEPTTGGSSGFEVPTPDPGTAALVGLAGLGAVAITAAGFATRRRGTPEPA
jgi:hypothetical protein